MANMSIDQRRAFLTRFIVERILQPPAITDPFYGYLFYIEAVLGAFANGLLLFVYARCISLHTPRNVYTANLLLGNLFNSILLVPLVYIPQTQQLWPHSRFACKLYNALAGLNIYCSTFSIIAICVDRYYHVRSTGGGTSKCNPYFLPLTVCALLWLMSLLLVSPLLLYYDLKPKDFNVTAHFGLPPEDPRGYILVGHNCQLKSPYHINVAIALLQTAFLLPLPLGIMTVYLVKLQAVIRRQNRIFKATTRRFRQGRRITLLLVLLVILFAGLWLPFHVISIMHDFEIEPSDEARITAFDTAFQLLGYSSLTVNPLLYGFLNQNFKRALRNLVSHASAINRNSAAVTSGLATNTRIFRLQHTPSSTRNRIPLTSTAARNETFL